MKDLCKQDDKLFEVVCRNSNLLCVVSRFGIGCGFGEKTIRRICEEKNIDCNTFLAVLNFHTKAKQYYDESMPLSIRCLCEYLQNTHRYYLDFLLPSIRKKLLESLGVLTNNDSAFMLLKFWDEYVVSVSSHMEKEEKEVFPYVDALLQGVKVKQIALEMTGMHSVPMAEQLAELKSLIIKFYAGDVNIDLLNSALHDIFLLEEDLMCHCKMEAILFVEQIKRLEHSCRSKRVSVSETNDGVGELSEREKEVVNCIVRGLSNKEIAESLFISVNTVATHRKNIARKTDIHSSAALALFAIMNKIVSVDELK